MIIRNLYTCCIGFIVFLFIPMISSGEMGDDPGEIGDIVYENAKFFGRWHTPGHVGIFVGNLLSSENPNALNMVIHSDLQTYTPNYLPEGFRKDNYTTRAIYAEKLNVFSDHAGYASKTTNPEPTPTQRSIITSYVLAKHDLPVSYYTNNPAMFFAPKGMYVRPDPDDLKANNLTEDQYLDLFAYEDHYNQFDCVGLAERAYEVAQLDPTPEKAEVLGFFWPDDQFDSENMQWAKVQPPEIILENYKTSRDAVSYFYFKPDNFDFSTFIRGETIKIFVNDRPLSSDAFKISWDYANNALKVQPINELGYGDRVKIVLNGIRDWAGNQLQEHIVNFQIQEEPLQEGSTINITDLKVSKAKLSSYENFIISGRAIYSTGQPVTAGEVDISIERGGDWTTSLKDDGTFSLDVQAPGNGSTSAITRTVTVIVTDGVVENPARSRISITINGVDETSPSYDVEEIATYNKIADVWPYVLPQYKTSVFSKNDKDVWVFVHLKNIKKQVHAKFKWYTPSGTLYYENETDYSDAGASEYCFWEGFSISEDGRYYEIAGKEGEWTCKVYIEEEFDGFRYVGTVKFTMRFGLREHKMAKEVDSDAAPVEAKRIFYTDDVRVISCSRFINVAEALRIKWEFYSPQGKYKEVIYQTEDPAEKGYSYFEWVNAYGFIDIHGTNVEHLCGQWHVDVFVQEPWGEFKKIYTDYFKIIERTHEAPVFDYFAANNPVIIGQTILLNISVSDKNDIDKVTVHWNDGTSHSKTWDRINSSMFQVSYSIGTEQYSSYQQIEYWAEAWDESGNRAESQHFSLFIEPETVTVPTLPRGPETGEIAKSISFSTGGAESNIGHDVEYQFDWGDGNVSSWGNATRTHVWSKLGEYEISVRARCRKDTYAISGWSGSARLLIVPPDLVIDRLVSNPSSGKIPLTVKFNCQAEVFNGAVVAQYRWDFDGDGIVDQMTTGNSVEHDYLKAGVYPVTCTVWDARGHTAISKPVKIIATPLTGDMVWAEDFNSYAEGTFPNTWIFSGNGGSIVSTDKGMSLSLQGQAGGCREGIAYRELGVDNRAFSVEFDAYVNRVEDGCHDNAANLHFTNGPDWTYHTGGLRIHFQIPDHSIIAYGPNAEKITLGSWQEQKWYHVRLDYWVSNSHKTAIIYIDGKKAGSINNVPLGDYDLDISYVGFGGGDGEAWVDNVRASQLNLIFQDELPVIDSLSTVDPSVGPVPLDVHFLCAAHDPDGGSIEEYRWDFDGDGNIDQITTKGEVQETYSTAGNYTATVVVVDDEGNEATKSITIVANEVAQSIPPVIDSFIANPSVGQVPLKVNFNCTAHDPDGGEIIEYHWDFNGDGVLDRITDADTVEEIYSESGNYKATCIVIDDEGTKTSKSLQLFIQDVSVSTNSAPWKPSVPAGPQSGTLGNNYVFSTSGSDPDGDKLTYQFDWGDGDKSDWGNEKKSHKWSGLGKYCIKARSKDSHGAISEWSDCHLFNVIQQNGDNAVAGDVQINSSWKTVHIPNVVDPVVIVGPPSYNGLDPGVMRLANIKAGSFDIRFQEWAYEDGYHISETASYLVLPKGRHLMPDGSVWEVGTFPLSGTGSWKRVEFSSSFKATPALFLSVQTFNGADPLVVRSRKVNETGFEAAFFEEEAKMDGHITEEVGYLAIYSPSLSGTAKIGSAEIPYLLQVVNLDQEFVPVLSFDLKLEEEQSKDQETIHIPETIAVLALGKHVFVQDVSSIGGDTASLRRLSPSFKTAMEWGTVYGLDNNWIKIPLLKDYINPVVVAKPASFNGHDPGVIRIRNVGHNSFEMRFNEWAYLDGVHTMEQVSYMVAEAGVQKIGGLLMEAGKLQSSTLLLEGQQPVRLNAGFLQTPGIFSAVQTFNGHDPVITRTQIEGPDAFYISMDEEEAKRDGHISETLGWIAIKPGTGRTVDGRSVTVFNERVSDVPKKIDLSNSVNRRYPVVISDISSSYGYDPCSLRFKDLTKSYIELFLQEEASLDKETRHVFEDVSVFSAE